MKKILLTIVMIMFMSTSSFALTYDKSSQTYIYSQEEHTKLVKEILKLKAENKKLAEVNINLESKISLTETKLSGTEAGYKELLKDSANEINRLSDRETKLLNDLSSSETVKNVSVFAFILSMISR